MEMEKDNYFDNKCFNLKVVGKYLFLSCIISIIIGCSDNDINSTSNIEEELQCPPDQSIEYPSNSIFILEKSFVDISVHKNDINLIRIVNDSMGTEHIYEKLDFEGSLLSTFTLLGNTGRSLIQNDVSGNSYIVSESRIENSADSIRFYKIDQLGNIDFTTMFSNSTGIIDLVNINIFEDYTHVVCKNLSDIEIIIFDNVSKSSNSVFIDISSDEYISNVSKTEGAYTLLTIENVGNRIRYILIDDLGALISDYTIFAKNNGAIRSSILHSDGSIVSCGVFFNESTNKGDIGIIKSEYTNGEIIWEKYLEKDIRHDLKFIHENIDETISFSGNFYCGTGISHAYFGRLDKSGDLVSEVYYQNNLTLSSHYITQLKYDDSNYVVVRDGFSPDLQKFVSLIGTLDIDGR